MQSLGGDLSRFSVPSRRVFGCKLLVCWNAFPEQLYPGIEIWQIAAQQGGFVVRADSRAATIASIQTYLSVSCGNELSEDHICRHSTEAAEACPGTGF